MRKPALHGIHGFCRQCAAPTPGVSWVTCGKSECQEQEARDNAVRAKAKRTRR